MKKIFSSPVLEYIFRHDCPDLTGVAGNAWRLSAIIIWCFCCCFHEASFIVSWLSKIAEFLFQRRLCETRSRRSKRLPPHSVKNANKIKKTVTHHTQKTYSTYKFLLS